MDPVAKKIARVMLETEATKFARALLELPKIDYTRIGNRLLEVLKQSKDGKLNTTEAGMLLGRLEVSCKRATSFMAELKGLNEELGKCVEDGNSSQAPRTTESPGGVYSVLLEFARTSLGLDFGRCLATTAQVYLAVEILAFMPFGGSRLARFRAIMLIFCRLTTAEEFMITEFATYEATPEHYGDPARGSYPADLDIRGILSPDVCFADDGVWRGACISSSLDSMTVVDEKVHQKLSQAFERLPYMAGARWV